MSVIGAISATPPQIIPPAVRISTQAWRGPQPDDRVAFGQCHGQCHGDCYAGSLAAEGGHQGLTPAERLAGTTAGG